MWTSITVDSIAATASAIATEVWVYPPAFSTIPSKEKPLSCNSLMISPSTLLWKVCSSKSGKSSIINIGSISGHQGSSLNPGYGASKSAIMGLTRALANDYGPKKIRVNTVTLGYFKTSMTIKSYNSKKRKKKIDSKMIIGRWGETKDLFGLAEYLISESASYITGQEFIVDGGWLVKGV